MDEDIHARVGGGKLGSIECAGENRCRHERFELGPVDTVTDDHQLQIVPAGQPGQPLHVLFRCQTSDEPDD